VRIPHLLPWHGSHQICWTIDAHCSLLKKSKTSKLAEDSDIENLKYIQAIAKRDIALVPNSSYVNSPGGNRRLLHWQITHTKMHSFVCEFVEVSIMTQIYGLTWWVHARKVSHRSSKFWDFRSTFYVQANQIRYSRPCITFASQLIRSKKRLNKKI
jgi:hypothetical protein